MCLFCLALGPILRLWELISNQCRHWTQLNAERKFLGKPFRASSPTIAPSLAHIQLMRHCLQGQRKKRGMGRGGGVLNVFPHSARVLLLLCGLWPLVRPYVCYVPSAPFRTNLCSLSGSILEAAMERKGLQGFVVPLPDKTVHSHTGWQRICWVLTLLHHPENHPQQG